MSSYFDGWTSGEAADQDVIKVKRVYIDMCGGNLVDAVLFSQIMYWHGRDKTGKTRLRVERDGHWWLAKRYEDWNEECRINANTARDVIKRLCDIGLLEKKIFHFKGRPIVHIRIVHEVFQRLAEAALETKRQAEEANSSLILREPSDGYDGSHQMDTTGTVGYYTETTDNEKDTPNGVEVPDEVTTGTDGTTEKPTSDRVAIRQEVIDGCKFADSVRNEKELYGRSGRITRYMMGQPAVEHKVTYTVVHEHWRAKPGDFTRFVQYWRGKYGDADVPRSLEKLHERWCEWREAEDRQQARLQKQLDATSPTLQAESVLYGGTEQEAA